MKLPDIHRGVVFRAVHDDTYEYWLASEPQAKFCVAFNLAPPSINDEVHYFLTTSNTARYTENPHLLSECLILKKGAYPFFNADTAIEFDHLYRVSFAKLIGKRLWVRGVLSASDIAACESAIRAGRVLAPKFRKLIGLL